MATRLMRHEAPGPARADGHGTPAGPTDPPGEVPATGDASGTEHALRALEFPRVLDLVARRASSPLGAERVRDLRPATAPGLARESLSLADEMGSFLLRDDGWAPPEIPDVREALDGLDVRSSVLEPDQLRRTGLLLRSSRRCRTPFLRWTSEFRRLAPVARRLCKAEELEERILESVDASGAVTDQASSALRRIRRRLRQARNGLVAELEDFASSLSDRYRVPDGSVTIRSGRYCIPVRREGQSEVGGLVHDESASRQTIFVEPPLAIEPMNRIRELELEERREVRRVLEALTDELRPLSEELRESLDALVELDALYARARYALDHGGNRPELTDGHEGYRVEGGIHPLLEASDGRAVPFDLTLSDDERVLLVSGPNAGGKTVLLKSIGLISVMAQSGIVPPVGPDTRLPVFHRFFAVIGDEQSIEASLSTFSAQVGNLREILEEAASGSLVLVDEIGGNTDPEEGAALAGSVLLRLSEQAGLTVATTHLGALKTLAEEDGRVVNASLQFDAAALRPTYRLVRDRPGRSYALEIAERLGIPRTVLEEARSRLTAEDRAVEDLLAELERREGEVERVEARLRRRDRELEERRNELDDRRRELEERCEELERRRGHLEREARERAEHYLLDARSRVEETIQRLEERFSEAESGDRESRRREAASRARAEVERAVRETRQAKPDEPARDREGPEAPEGLEEGETVRITSLERTGRVAELRGDQVVVASDGLRLTVPASELQRVPGEMPATGSGEGSPGAGPPDGGGEVTRPSLEARPEVDLRGLRVHEVERPLQSALDAAVVADLPRVRIIHGKGTGALRQRVRELLSADGRVQGVRGGDPGEGGAGVTVAELRETAEGGEE